MDYNSNLEIYKLLGFGRDQDQDKDTGHAHEQESHEAPVNLPLAQTDEHLSALDLELPVPVIEDLKHPVEIHEARTPRPILSQSVKSNLIFYPLIFVLAFAFFYSVLNFSSLVSQVQAWFVKPEEEQVLGENLQEYYKWIGGYYFFVGSLELLEPAGDIDKDGLSNMDEFAMRTNPTVFDSDSDGFSDGIELINSTNPWGEGSMSNKQKKLAEGIDLIRVNNRISYNVAASKPEDLRVLGEQKINFDVNTPGKLSVPKLGLQVPIIWTQDPVNFDQDLTKGVVHYPGTVMPGEKGTVYISGHSSDYIWKNHPYRYVFSKLNSLQPGDDIFVDLYGVDGKLYNFRYKVVSENVYRPDDQTQFIDNSGSKLNLSTCWPIGTQKDRYVVSAVLEGV